MNRKSTGRSDRIKTLRLLIVIAILMVIAVAWDSVQPDVRLFGSGLATILALGLIAGRPWKDPIWRHPIVLAVVAAGGLHILLSFRAPYWRPALELAMRNLALIASMVFVVLTLRNGWSRQSWIEGLQIVALVFVVVEGLLAALWYARWLSLPARSGLLPPVGYRPSGLFLGHPNVLAGFLVLVTPLTLAQAAEASSRLRRWGNLCLAAAFAFTIALSSSRGAMLAAAASLGIPAAIWAYERFAHDQNLREIWQSLRASLPLPAMLGGLLLVGALGLIAVTQIVSTGHAPIGEARSEVWGTALRLIREEPLWGTGLGSFAPRFARLSATLPATDATHTHNLLLQAWLEGGLATLLIVLILVPLTVSSWLRVRRKAGRAGRYAMLGLAGSIVGFATHQLFDFLLGPPLYSVTFGIILAMILVQDDHSLARAKTLSLPAMAVVLIGAAAFPLVLLRSIPADRLHWQAVQASMAGKWQDAALSACEAADQTPDLPLFVFDCGIATSYADYPFEANGSHAGTALQKAVSLDSNWPLHAANAALAASRVEASLSGAEELMTRTVDSASEVESLWLNLATIRWMLGDREGARRALQEALRLEPRGSQAWPEELRRELRGDLLRLRDLDSLEPPMRLLALADEAIESGDLETASRLSTETLELQSTSFAAHVETGRVLLAQGSATEAWSIANEAIFLRPTDLRGLELAAEAALQMGEDDLARAILMEIAQLLATPNHSRHYYFSTYHRFNLVTDVIPGYSTGTLTSSLRGKLIAVLEGEIGPPPSSTDLTIIELALTR